MFPASLLCVCDLLCVLRTTGRPADIALLQFVSVDGHLVIDVSCARVRTPSTHKNFGSNVINYLEAKEDTKTREKDEHGLPAQHRFIPAIFTEYGRCGP